MFFIKSHFLIFLIDAYKLYALSLKTIIFKKWKKKTHNKTIFHSRRKLQFKERAIATPAIYVL